MSRADSAHHWLFFYQHYFVSFIFSLSLLFALSPDLVCLVELLVKLLLCNCFCCILGFFPFVFILLRSTISSYCHTNAVNSNPFWNKFTIRVSGCYYFEVSLFAFTTFRFCLDVFCMFICPSNCIRQIFFPLPYPLNDI